MQNEKNKSIAETFRSKLKTPWIWMMVSFTIGLTILFSLSQKPQLVMYSQYIKTLSDFQLLDARFMQSMERARTGYAVDSMLILSQSMTLREMAVSFSRQMDELQLWNVKKPDSDLMGRFERDAYGKVSGARRYLTLRTEWIKSCELLKKELSVLSREQEVQVRSILDSARNGMVVERPETLLLPDSIQNKIDFLLAENAEHAIAWKKFSNDVSLMSSEEIIQFFQMKRLEEVALNAKVPMVFYFLTLVLLLSTFFFIFRSKQ